MEEIENCNLVAFRNSLEVTLTFLIVILVSLLLFILPQSSSSSFPANQTLPANQILRQQYYSQNRFWIVFYKSTAFQVLISSIILSWLFLALSYLLNSEKKQFCILICMVISILATILASIAILCQNANYIPPYLEIFVLTVATLVWVSFVSIKAHICYTSLFKK